MRVYGNEKNVHDFRRNFRCEGNYGSGGISRACSILQDKLEFCRDTGLYLYEAHGSCPGSVETALVNHGMAKLSGELDLVVDICGDGNEFREHYVFAKGIKEIDISAPCEEYAVYEELSDWEFQKRYGKSVCELLKSGRSYDSVLAERADIYAKLDAEPKEHLAALYQLLTGVCIPTSEYDLDEGVFRTKDYPDYTFVGALDLQKYLGVS